MKSILYLGVAFIVLISSQIYLEQQNRLSPEGTDSENDSLSTRYKILNGRIYYLSENDHWQATDLAYWSGKNGYYYFVQSGMFYQSANGIQWEPVSNKEQALFR